MTSSGTLDAALENSVRHVAPLEARCLLHQARRADRRSGKGTADEMTVLVYGPGQHGEVHLPVVIDCHYPDDCLGLVVARDQHHSRADPTWIAGLAQRGPAESLIVFVVEVGCQVDARFDQVSSAIQVTRRGRHSA